MIYRKGKERIKDTESFKRLCNKVHNNYYDYSESEYINSRTKVTISCPQHGQFLQMASDHFKGRGCPKCGQKKTKDSTVANYKEIFRKFIEVHGDKYEYVHETYAGSYTPMTMFCPIHGEFSQKPSSHILGHGCNQCGEESRYEKLRLGSEEIKKRLEHHRDAPVVDFSKINATNTGDRVNLVCSKHGEFNIRVGKLLSGSGCKQCAYSLSRGWYSGDLTKECTFYILLVKDFIKVGMSTNITKRLNTIGREISKDYILIDSFTTDVNTALDLEVEIKKLWREDSYEYDEKFDGYTECFSESVLDDILKFTKKYLEGEYP